MTSEETLNSVLDDIAQLLALAHRRDMLMCLRFREAVRARALRQASRKDELPDFM